MSASAKEPAGMAEPDYLKLTGRTHYRFTQQGVKLPAFKVGHSCRFRLGEIGASTDAQMAAIWRDGGRR
jgi:hypothetical protein